MHTHTKRQQKIKHHRKCLENDSVFNQHFDKEKQYKKDERPRQAWNDCGI